MAKGDQGSKPAAPRAPSKSTTLHDQDSDDSSDNVAALMKQLQAAKKKKKQKEQKRKKAKVAKERDAEQDWQAQNSGKPITSSKEHDISGDDESGHSEKQSKKTSAAPFDSGDESDNFATIAKKATPATKRSRGQKSPSESEHSDGDAPTRKKSKTAGANITVSSPLTLKSTLGRPRKAKAVAGAQSAATPASATAASSPAAAGSQYTPYMRRVNPKAENKPRGDDFSPTTKRLAEDLRTDFVVKMVEQHAFMDDDTAHTVVDGLVEKKTKGAEEGSKTERRGKRYEWEEEYRKDLRNAVKNVASTFRGHVVEAAEPLILTQYSLNKLDKQNREREVAKLTGDATFAFEDTEEREGYLANPIISELFAWAFLRKKSGGKKKQPLAFGPHLDVFQPVPNHLLAFLLTAIECALRHWTSGVFVDEPFTTSVYDGIYDKHLTSIEAIAAKDPAYLQEMKDEIWASACESAGVQPSIIVHDQQHVDGYLAGDDISKLTRRKNKS